MQTLRRMTLITLPLLAMFVVVALALPLADVQALTVSGSVTVGTPGGGGGGGGGGAGGGGGTFGTTALDAHCPAGGGIVERLVTCIEDVIMDVAYGFIIEVYPPLQSTIYALLTLAVIFLGGLMMAGMLEKPGRDGMVFLLKFAAIVYFTANMLEILDWTVGALHELLEIVTEFAVFDFPLKCPSAFNVWQRIDCLIDVIVGVNTPASLTDGMLAFFFHNFFVGSVGVIIFMLGIWVLLAFVMGMLTAIQVYLLAIMMLVLLVIVGILFLPLIIFKNTFDYFQKWVRFTIATVLIPIILFAYLNVMLSAFDIVLYSGEYSVFRTFAGDAVDAEDFRIHEYMYNNGLVLEYEDKGVVHDQRQTVFPTPKGQQLEGELFQFGEYPIGPGTLGSVDISQIPIAIPMKQIDYDAAAGLVGAADGITLMEEVFAAMILTALVSYILVAMLKYVPMMAEDLAGGLREAPSIAQVAAGDMPVMGGANGMGGRAVSGLRQRMSNMVTGR